MNDVTKETIREIADHGFSTVGIVSTFAIGAIAVRDLGPVGVLAPIAMVAVLGVTGYWAVDSIDRVVREK